MNIKGSMIDVYSTSVLESTLDEAPQAYNSINTIIDNIRDAVEVVGEMFRKDEFSVMYIKHNRSSI